MSFLAPWNFLWLLLAPLIVALHLFRRPRSTTRVSSTWLWLASQRQLASNQSLRRLRPYVSMLIQLAALLAGVLFLVQPRWGEEEATGRALTLVFDASASMMAVDDEGRSALDRAKARALAMVQTLEAQDSVALVVAGPSARLVSAQTRDRGQTERALHGIDVLGERADLARALDLAARQPGRTVLLTDGAAAPVEWRGASILSVERFSGGTNAAIVAAGFVGERDLRLVGRVKRTTTSPIRLVLRQGPRLVAEQLFEGGMDDLSFSLEPGSLGAGFLRLELRASDGSVWRDSLAIDDVVHLPAPRSDGLRVRIAEDVPRSVVRGLEASSLVERTNTGSADLYVYGGSLPLTLPRGEALIFATDAFEGFGVSSSPATQAVAITRWRDADRRLRFVNFDGVSFGASRILRGGSMLARARSGTVILSKTHPLGRATFVGTNPDESWHRDPSFVLFLRNMLEAARRRRDAGGELPASLGMPIAGSDEAEVRAPSGARVEDPEGVLPPEIGPFEVRRSDRTTYALRNLLSEAESDLSPRFEALAGPTLRSRTQAPAQGRSGTWLCVLLLILLVADGLYATRGGKRLRR